MGGGLKRGRTAAALILTFVAVAIPCAAWYLAGTGQITREAQLQKKGVRSAAHQKAVILAERLATRLEVLRESESGRPFYHYQNLYHDPKGAAEGASVSISPLAQGPADPLIDAHFQVDENGHLTLPTLNDEFPELGLHSKEDAQCSMLWKLRDLAVFCDLESFGDLHDSDSRWPLTPGREGDGSGRSVVVTETLGALAWRQHMTANALYADLKKHQKPMTALQLGDEPLPDQVLEIRRGSLQWHTLPVGSETSLVALRKVETPAGIWTQGFVVASETVAQMLENSFFPPVFEPRAEWIGDLGEEFVVAQIDGTPWQVRLDVAHRLAEKEQLTASARGRFLRGFLFGSLGASLAGLLVVVMVSQSERLAQQRMQFAASAAHELRTPLAGLRLYGEMLSEGLGDPKRSQDYARRMAAEAERLGRVVTNVLGFTRLEQGSISVQTQCGDIADAVKAAVSRQRPAIEQSGADIELRIEDDLPSVHFDRDAVGHIVQNLLDNAEKYTRDIADRKIVISVEQEQDAVVLAVADNGHGVGKALRRRLFKPFARGQKQDSPEGLGLGLVLVKNLVLAQGARIAYSDGPAGGALFRVNFPLP